MILRLPWAELKWYFITNRGPKQGVTRNIVTLKVDCQKISIQEQFQNKPEKVNFFNYISSTKKKSEQFKEFQNHWAPWNSLYGITCTPTPQLYVLHPPTKGSLQLFKKFHDLSPPPPPANKSKFEIFQSPISIEGVYTMHLMLPIYVEYFWSSSLLSCNKDSEGFSK